MSRQPIVLCFSGGKDSALALQALQRQPAYDVVQLLTTVTSEYDRVSMHGVRRGLLRMQAEALGLGLTEVAVPPGASNAVYEREMGRAVARWHARGIRHMAFGDIFLEDLRTYREQRLRAAGLACVFPLWQRDTAALAREFIETGFRATVVCVNTAQLDASFAGRPFDEAFLRDLPAHVDPCGERGEFHTCVLDGPTFQWPITVRPGPLVERDGFVFCDLRPRRDPGDAGADKE